jgi:Family of unknown function (DUF6199)
MSTNTRRCARCGNEYGPEMLPATATLCLECQRQANEAASLAKSANEDRKTALIAFLIITALFAIPAIFAVAAPYPIWFISEGWRYENLEPSDANLVVIRLGGGLILLALAVIWLFIFSRRT